MTLGAGSSAPILLDHLDQVYQEARSRSESTLVFQIRKGLGQFVFMVFFDEEDSKETRESLFLFLARTGALVKIKIYGTLRNGDFRIYPNPHLEALVRAELGIQSGGTEPFDLRKFFSELNLEIPQTLTWRQKADILRAHSNALAGHREMREVVDQATKIFLIGPKNLPPGAMPREKTLRKLVLYLDADLEEVEELIRELRKRNKTVAWSASSERAKTLRECLLNM